MLTGAAQKILVRLFEARASLGDEIGHFFTDTFVAKAVLDTLAVCWRAILTDLPFTLDVGDGDFDTDDGLELTGDEGIRGVVDTPG